MKYFEFHWKKDYQSITHLSFQKNFFIGFSGRLAYSQRLTLFFHTFSQITPFFCALINYVNENAPLDPYLFHFQAEDRQQNLTYFMRADGTREGKCLETTYN